MRCLAMLRIVLRLNLFMYLLHVLTMADPLGEDAEAQPLEKARPGAHILELISTATVEPHTLATGTT